MFSSFIACKRGRNVFLIVNNSSSHRKVENIPKLENVNVSFLPPNTTLRLQPMDAGIISAVKRRYRRFQYEHSLDTLEVPNFENKNVLSRPAKCPERNLSHLEGLAGRNVLKFQAAHKSDFGDVYFCLGRRFEIYS